MQILKRVSPIALAVILSIGTVFYAQPHVVEAAVSADSTAAAGGGAVSSLSYIHTINTLSNTELIIGVTARGSTGRTITSVTVNGANASLYASSSISLWELANIWDFAATTSGANAIVITFSGAVGSNAQATSTALNGIDPTTPRDGQGCNSGTGTAALGTSQVTTSASGDYLVDSLITRTTNAASPGTGQIGDHRLPGAGQAAGSYKAATTTGAQSMWWTWVSASLADWVSCTAAYQPVAVAAAPAPHVVIQGKTIVKAKMVIN